MEKAERMTLKDPWASTKRNSIRIILIIGWVLIAMIIYQLAQFDYEMANFDPYEILGVAYDSTAKEIKKKYRFVNENNQRFFSDRYLDTARLTFSI